LFQNEAGNDMLSAGINFAKIVPLAINIHHMKIRIKGNSLRFRLRKHDIALLCNNGSITERIEFGETADQQIGFSLESGDQARMGIVYKDNMVRISIPKRQLDEWNNTEQVGMAQDLITETNKIISLLIEKDFACLDASEEDNRDAYPNPLAGNTA
jgi:hypothetical protein